MNEKEFNGLILAELVKIANEVFTNEIEIAPGTYTAAELAKLKDANGNEINIKYLCPIKLFMEEKKDKILLIML